MFKIFIFLSILSKIFEARSLEKCDSYTKIPFIEDGYEINIPICLNCEDQYIMTPNHQDCLHAIYDMGQQGFMNCQRIDHNGSCAEAVFGIDLIGKDKFSFVTHQVFADRCAILDPSYLTCLYPRLNYVLDIKKQQIWFDQKRTFCSLFDLDLNICIEYRPGFIFDEKTGRTLFLGELFQNPEQIVQNGKGPSDIQCKQNYEFIRKTKEFSDIFYQKYNKTEVIGCFLTNTTKLSIGIENCEEYLHSTTICKRCAMGYSISQDGQQCKMVAENCEVFATYFGEEICSKCKPFYKREYRQCVRIVGCIMLSEKNQNQCIGCTRKHALVNNECIPSNVQIPYNCIAQGEGGACIKCMRPDKYFVYKSYAGTWECGERKQSIYCAQKRDNRDACVNSQCEEGYYFKFQQEFENEKFSNTHTIKQLPQSYYKFLQEEMIKNERAYSEFKLVKSICVKRNNTIENCEKYSPIEDTCFECKKGFQKVFVRLNEGIEEFKCQNITLPIQKRIIDNCLEYDINEQFCKKCKQFYFYDEQIDGCVFIEACTAPRFSFRNDESYRNKQEIKSCQTCAQSYYQLQYQYACTKIETSDVYMLDKRTGEHLQDTSFPNCKIIDEIPQSDNEDFSNNSDSNNKDSTSLIQTKLGCIECNSGYVLDRGICICVTEYCKGIYVCNPQQGCFKSLQRGYRDSNKYLQGNLSLPINYFVSSINKYEYRFERCNIWDCQICKNNSYCYQCESGKYFNIKLKKCVEICNSTTCVDPWEVNNQTEIKSYPCKKKSNDSQKCVQCDSDSQYVWLADQKCHPDCPLNYSQTILVLEGSVQICYQCPENCLSCTIKEYIYQEYGIATCLSCLPGKYLLQGRCYNECTYFKDEENNCHLECPKDMFTEGDRCIKSCPKWYGPIPRKENSMRCLDKCTVERPHSYPDKPFYCTESCDVGYASKSEGQNKKTCLKCKQDSCYRCQEQDVSKCTFCKDGYTLLGGDLQCVFKCQNGEYVSHADECKLKCIYPYCAKCSENNRFCEKCIDGFQLTNNLNCYCEPGKFVNKLSGKCDFCHPQCSFCNQEKGCNKCNEGFYLISTLISSTSSLSKLDNTTFTCTETCPIGTYPTLSSTNDNNKVPSCLKCPQVGCTSCKSPTQCLDCSGKFHLKYDSSTKQYNCECKPGYFLDGDECKFKCANLRIVEHEQDCCSVENCDQCIRNKDQCERCNSLFPLLINNKCIRSCPDGTFANQEGNKCQKCHPLCSTCDKSPTQCTSCSLPASIANVKTNCRCILGYYYYKGKCVAECPLYTYMKSDDSVSPHLKVCEEFCNENENQYPLFNKAGSFISCEDLSNVSYENSLFCDQHLSKLLQLIKFELIESKQNLNQIDLNVSLSSTPLNCYSFKLRGKHDYEVEIENTDNQQSSNIFVLRYQLNKKDLKNSKQVECSSGYCYLDFEIYQSRELRLTIKIKLNVLQSVATIEGIKDPQVISSTSTQLIDSSSLEKNQTLPSSQQVQCASSSLCNFRNITTLLNTQVSITLTAIQQYLSSQHILDIHSIYLVSEDDEKQIQPVKNFYFENFFSSNTLKIMLSFEREVTGKLVIICEAKSKIGNNQEHSEDGDREINQAPQFLVSQTHLNVKRELNISKENEEILPSISEDSNTQVNSEANNNISFSFILLLFNTIICSIIFFYCLFKVYSFFSNKRSVTEFKQMSEERIESISIELK